MAIKIPIFADYNDRGVRDAESSFETFGQKVGGIAKAAATAFLAVGTAAGVGAYKAIGMASDLAESTSKVGQIFGTSGKDITDFSKTAAKSLGLSEQNVLDAAGTFGIFGKAAGLGGAELSTFSNDFTTLAADLASFNNTTPEDAIQAIGSALRGESEPLRRYGVMLDDAALKAEAMAQGIYDGKGPLTQQQKILAAQAAIFKQTADAQGDFERTSGGLANQQKILKATFANVATTIGTKLLPVFMTVVSFISDKIIPGVEKITDAFSKGGLAGVIDLVKQQLPKLKQFLADAGTALWEWIQDAYPPALRALGEMFYAFGQWLLNTGLPWLVDALGKGAKALWAWIEEAAPPALKRLGELIGDLANWLIDEGLPKLVEKLIELGNAFVDWIKPLIVPMLGKLGELLLTILNWVVTEAVPKIANQAVKLAGAMLGWIAQLLPEAATGLAKFAVQLIAKIPGLFIDLVGTMISVGAQMGNALIDALVTALKGLGEKGMDIGKSFANGIIKFINSKVIDKINDLVEFKISAFGFSATINPPDVPQIPMLAKGGIVTGPTIAMIGEAGSEAVIPLDRLGSFGGNTITVNVNGGDPNSIVRALQQYVRQSGPVPLNTRAM